MSAREAPENCVFCRIIAGESPVSKVYEDGRVLALMTIGPVTTGHAMVIPKGRTAGLIRAAYESLYPSGGGAGDVVQ
jgi:histidine triad (HIT) family protein